MVYIVYYAYYSMEDLEVYCQHSDLVCFIFMFYKDSDNAKEFFELCGPPGCTNPQLCIEYLYTRTHAELIKIIEKLSEFNKWVKDNSTKDFLSMVAETIEKFKKTNKQDQIDTSEADQTLKNMLLDNVEELYKDSTGCQNFILCSRHIGPGGCFNNFKNVVKHRKIEEIISVIDKVPMQHNHSTYNNVYYQERIKKIQDIKNTVKLRNIEESMKNMDKAINDNTQNTADIINLFTNIDKNRTNLEDKVDKLETKINNIEANINQILVMLQKS